MHATVALGLAVTHNIIADFATAFARSAFAGGGFVDALRRSATDGVRLGVFTGVVYYAVVALFYAALALRRLCVAEQVGAAALRAELTQSKLDMLRSHLRPHFLFNTLNAISVFVGEDSAKAQQMILRLSTLLRRSLDEEAQEVALEEELAFGMTTSTSSAAVSAIGSSWPWTCATTFSGRTCPCSFSSLFSRTRSSMAGPMNGRPS